MSLQNLICYSLNYSTNLDLQSLPKNCNIVEIKLQNLENLDVLKLKSEIKLPIIFSCFKPKNCGLFSGNQEDQIQIYNQLLTLGLDYLEIELELIGLLNLTQKHPQTKIILTNTDLNQTPGYRNLRKIAKRMAGFKPSFFKFNYNLKTDKDSLNILRLLLSRKNKDKFIIKTIGLNAEIVNQTAGVFGSKIEYLN